MVVQNNGGANVELDSALTKLIFNIFGQGDKSGEYTLVEPLTFTGSGTDVLAGGATDSLLFTINVTGTTAGALTLGGNFAGTDLNSSAPVSDNTADGGSANLAVETPAVLSIMSITPSQPTLSEMQDSAWTVAMLVENTGESEIVLQTSPDSTGINFTIGAGWAWNPAAFAGGDTLAGNSSKVISFPMTKAGDKFGPVRIDGWVRGLQTNDGTGKYFSTIASGTGFGGVTVQTSPILAVENITVTQTPVTMGQTQPWNVEVEVSNSGGALPRLDLVATAITFAGADSGSFVLQPPTGQDSVPDHTSTILTFAVTQTPTYATAGRQPISVSIIATDTNTGGPAQTAVGADSFTVEFVPVPTYIAGSVSPAAVSRGSSVSFSIDITSAAGMATVVLDRNATQLTVDDGQGNVLTPRLSPLSDSTIEAGVPSTLQFESVTVPSNFALGKYLLPIQLQGSENGNAFALAVDVAPDSVEIKLPPDVNIEQIVPSQNRITQNQTRSWTAKMVVKNNGTSSVVVNPAQTALNLSIGGSDVTGEYGIPPTPVAFDVSGDDTLRAGVTDTLTYTITPSGSTLGQLLINGTFAGTDVESSLPVTDNTGDGGLATLLVESPGSIVITQLVPSQTTATINQTENWQIVAHVTNPGQADVLLDFTAAPRPRIREMNFTTFVFQVPDSLAGQGDSILSGGETDSLVFIVDTTGMIAGNDVFDVDVWGTEINSGDARFDNTDGVASIIINMQTPAILNIFDVVPSIDPVTMGQTDDWTVDVTLWNEGGADIALDFAALVTNVTFTGATVPATIVQPTDDNILTGGEFQVISFTVDQAPTYATPGLKPIDVAVQGIETNRNLVVQGAGADNVTMNLAPDPQYQAASLAPPSVSLGSNVNFSVDVTQLADMASVTLTRATTTFTLDDGLGHIVTPNLSGASDNTIDANGATHLVFENTFIDPAFVTGTYLPVIQLEGISNGMPFSLALPIGTDSVTIQDASQDGHHGRAEQRWRERRARFGIDKADLQHLRPGRQVRRIHGLADFELHRVRNQRALRRRHRLIALYDHSDRYNAGCLDPERLVRGHRSQ
jgi:hypothetical protein